MGIESYHQSIKRTRIRIQKLFYKKKYTAEQIIDVLKEMGLKKGSVICIHTSMKEMFNYNGTIKELLDRIIEEIGENGTLMMSAIPKDLSYDKVVDIRERNCRTGIIPETFRKEYKVERSNNLYHSVIAYGKEAKYLTAEHHLSCTCWDQYSPYWKLGLLKGIVINIGMGRNYIGTISHVPESILRKEVKYFSLFFNKIVDYQFRTEDGVIKRHTLLVGEGIERNPSNQWKVVKKYFSRDKYKVKKISNLVITSYDAEYTINRLIELGRKGIVIYKTPKPRKELFQ